MEFIPTSALIDLTLVNTTWGREARNHLKSRTALVLQTEENHCQRITNYLDMPDCRETPKSVKFTFYNENNINQFFSHFDQFSQKYSKIVQKLSVRWVLTNGKYDSHQFWKICSGFANIVSYKICCSPCLKKDFTDTDLSNILKDRDLIPTGIRFHKVSDLSIDMDLIGTSNRSNPGYDLFKKRLSWSKMQEECGPSLKTRSCK